MKKNNQIFKVEEAFGFIINEYEVEKGFTIDSLLKTTVLDIELLPEHLNISLTDTISQHGHQCGYLKGLFYQTIAMFVIKMILIIHLLNVNAVQNYIQILIQ